MRRVALLGLALCGAVLVPRRAGAQRLLTVIADDTGLVASPTVPAGIITVRLVLQGKARRELVVHRVPAGTPVAALAAEAAGRPVRWFERWSFGGPAVPRAPARDASVTLDLRPGRYTLVAYEVDEAGRPRGARYLWREIDVIAASVFIPARFPVPDAAVKVRDARVDVTGTLRPGQRTLQVQNVGGRPHEVIVGRLLPGKTLDDVRRWDAARDESPPFVYVGGVTPMSGSTEAQARLVLQRGQHVVLCRMREDGAKAYDYQRGVLGTFIVN